MNDSLLKRQDFAPRCSTGGTWWACGYGTYFVGCCARDPCDITCAQGNLYPGGFDAAAYGTFPDATCGTGSKFYTCAAGNTFWGCCKTNACSQKGCPDGDLEPAIMNRDDQLLAYHATGGAKTLASATHATTAGPTGTSGKVEDNHGPPVAAIAGGSAAGALVLVVVIGLLVYYCVVKRSRTKNAERLSNDEHSLKDTPHLHQHRDPPPNYASPNPALYSHSIPHPEPTYYAYNHTHQAHPPQELPLAPMSPTTTRSHLHSGKSPLSPSELSGDAGISLSELGTPETSPQPRQGEFKSVPSPFLLSELAELEPLQPVIGGYAGPGQHSRSSEMSPLSEIEVDWGERSEADFHHKAEAERARDREAVGASPASMKSTWVAPPDWGFCSPAEGMDRKTRTSWAERPIGLGVDGVDAFMSRMERMDRLDDQRAVLRRPRHDGNGRPGADDQHHDEDDDDDGGGGGHSKN